MKLAVVKYCQLKGSEILIDGMVAYSVPAGASMAENLTKLYRMAQLQYPKFFKMDYLSKTGFLAAEMLINGTSLHNDLPKTKTSVFIVNKSASLDTDEAYQKTIGDNYFPSPSVFVYTLPNIVAGEISIRHKIFGENTCFVSESLNNQSVFDYIYQSFLETDINNAIFGWVDYYQNHGEAFFLLVEKPEDESIVACEFSKELVINLIK